MPTKKTKPPITEAERERIAERHADIAQDTLPGMPERPAQPPKKRRAADPSKPVWRRVKGGVKTRPAICGDCIREIQIDGSSPARPVVWRRTQDGKFVELCQPHAEPIKSADEAARPKKKRRHRKWQR